MVLYTTSDLSFSNLPTGTLTPELFILFAMELADISKAFSLFLSSSTWISLLVPPMIRTDPTSLTCSISDFIVSLARSYSFVGGRLADTARRITGMSIGSNLLMRGSSIPSGSFGLARAILSLTCCSAYLMSVSRVNSTVTIDMPSMFLEEILFKPERETISSSTGLEMRFSISSGAEPEYMVVMDIMGKFTSGKRSTPSLFRDIIPTNINKMTRLAMKMGRFIENCAILNEYFIE